MPSQYPVEGWTPGQPLANYREIVYGSYIFPLTFQEVTREAQLSVNRIKLPFNSGEFIGQSVQLIGRDVNIVGTIGSGMMGSGGNTLVTATDLENERSLLAGFQLTTNNLWVRPDRYLKAKMSDFSHKFMQDGGGFRYADWDIKFIADDPRYYSTTVHSANSGQITSTAKTNFAASQDNLGNVNAFPTFVITGSGTGPYVIGAQTVSPSPYIEIRFSTLTMSAGDTLVISCDPRPEVRQICAQWTHSGVTVNALPYCVPATDLFNNLDARYVLPYMDPVNLTSFYCGMTGGSPNYNCTVTWQDTWI
jgi:hypothetical protein